MKLTSMLAALAAFAILTGCDTPAPGLLSLEAVAIDSDTATDNALPGTWQSQGDKDLIVIIRQADDGGYQIAALSGGSVMNFGAKLFRVKDAEFLDLSPADDNDFRIPGHAVARVWIDGPAFHWAFLDSDWLKQKAAALATHSGDGKMQVFSPTDSVRAFIVANGTNDKAYGQMATLQRVQ
jgi:hypothetical protein